MFKPNKQDIGMSLPVEYIPATASEVYAAGEAVYLDDGAVTLCAGATAPGFIAVGPADNGCVPCIRVSANVELATVFSVAATGLVPGDKVTISADGMSVTATTTSGVAEIVSMEGTAAGSGVCVRF